MTIAELADLKPGEYRFAGFDGGELIPVKNAGAIVTVYRNWHYMVMTLTALGEVRHDVFHFAGGDPAKVDRHAHFFRASDEGVMIT